MATGISETDVWTAADALLLEGARPTIERVRQKIGRGSPNTVSPYLETWFRALGARIKDPGAFAAPPAVPDPIAQAAAHFWDTALSTARAEQAESYRQRWAELEAESAGLAAQADRLAAREAQVASRERDMQAALELATAQLAATDERLQSAEIRLRQREGQLGAAEEQLHEARQGVEALQAEAERARAAHAEALAALESRHAAHERRWLNELDAERGAVKRLQARLDEASAGAQRKAAELQAALDQEKDQSRKQEQASLLLRAEAAALQEQLKLRQDASDAAAHAAQNALRQLERDMGARLGVAESLLADSRAQLQLKDGQLADLTRHLVSLTAAHRQAPPPEEAAT